MTPCRERIRDYELENVKGPENMTEAAELMQRMQATRADVAEQMQRLEDIEKQVAAFWATMARIQAANVNRVGSASDPMFRR